MKSLNWKFWASLWIFGLVGQIAWVVENMYLNVFIYKMFHATPGDISLMVAASAVAATITTILMGTLSDYMGRRKLLICVGYVFWGISIIGFGLVRTNTIGALSGNLAGAASLCISMVIALDCVMTFFGSTANDASFNAWLTDRGDETNRGKIEGINSMMPLLAILLVFGGFMGFNLDLAQSWTRLFWIIGIGVCVMGVLGFFLIEEPDNLERHKQPYWQSVIYSFRPSVMKSNTLLYAVIGAFAVFGISIQVFMPYLIIYYEKTLGMTDYVLIMAPAILLAAIFTVLYGRLYDKLGFGMSVVPAVMILMAGYVILYFTTTRVPVFIGSFLMMSGYLSGMAVFGAMIRQHIPQQKAGQFQGIRIIGQVLIPGNIGPAIGAAVLSNAAMITNSDGTQSFLPNRNIWLAAFLTAILLLIVLCLIFRMQRKGHYELLTREGEKVLQEEQKWDGDPSPMMHRSETLNLNGPWICNGQSIQVPFAPQSILSHFTGRVPGKLTYEKRFYIPSSFQSDRILLHFGGVDQIAEVWVNEEKVGIHEGGYLSFTMDITKFVHPDQENQIQVLVTDRLSKVYPYGKQKKRRGGMWYTPVSGIWQSVWLECVPQVYIRNVKLTPDLAGVRIKLDFGGVKIDDNPLEQEDHITQTKQFSIELKADNQLVQRTFTGVEGYLDLTEYHPKLWTPEHPYLYHMKITSGKDTLLTYFALRTVEICKVDGYQRICLNQKPVFLHGVLDQGYYPDGIFTPAEPEEFERDILRMKKLGFNMLRKHIKVEPEAFYEACDRLGMLVLQDMVNNGRYSFLRDTAFPTIGILNRKDTKGRDNKRRQIFVQHMKDTQEQLYNHPCVIGYTLFNEGWGQFTSDKVYKVAKKKDPSRFYDATSGWYAQTRSDVESLHIYFGKKELSASDKPLFLSEFGGFSYQVPSHYFSKYNLYGYGTCESKEELTDKIKDEYTSMVIPGIQNGLCGSVYTQLSDVEDEVNGLYTYDRKICKIIPDEIVKISSKILEK